MIFVLYYYINCIFQIKKKFRGTHYFCLYLYNINILLKEKNSYYFDNKFIIIIIIIFYFLR